MNIVLLGQQSFYRFVGRILNAVLPAVQQDVYPPVLAGSAPKNIAGYAVPARVSGQIGSQPQVKPLRVVRVVESGQTRSSVGRMVISGRMADVCAELDRLAACEAALT